MKIIIHFISVLIVTVMLQACSATLEHMNLTSALEHNDLNAFKSEVQHIKNNQSYTQQTKDDLLYDALTLSTRKNKEAVIFLIEQGVPVDYPANQPDSFVRGKALSNAVIRNDKEIVQLLLAHGADANIVIEPIEPEENNILLLSLNHDDLAIARMLLESGANPNQWKSLFISSLLALYDDNTNVQNLLIEYGGVVNPTQAQRFGYTLSKTPIVITKTPTPVSQTVITNKLSDRNSSKSITADIAVIPVVTNSASLPSTNSTIDNTQMNKITTSIKERLENIKILKSQGVITDDEYSQARQKILDEL